MDDVAVGGQGLICRGHLVRYFYHGENAEAGRFVRVPPTCSDNHSTAFMNVLEDVADLKVFAPYIRSASEDAFVPLTEEALRREAMEWCCADPVRLRRVDVCFFHRKWTAEAEWMSTDRGMECDSQAVGLTASFFAVGIVRGRAASNHGSVWRSALQFGAAYTFTVGASYAPKVESSADVYKTHRQIPCIGYRDVEALLAGVPFGASLVAIEYGGVPLMEFVHPKRAVYVLGDEREGLPRSVVRSCMHHVSIGTAEGRPDSLNVAAAAAIVMYDRFCKQVRSIGGIGGIGGGGGGGGVLHLEGPDHS